MKRPTRTPVELITLAEAARRLDVCTKTILRRRLGTHDLTHVRRPDNRVYLIVAEVDEVRARWIDDGVRRRPDQVARRHFRLM